uniref:Uncharacterized protein n=1 Tax=viral metagenome TaxID=1070528 RepID=A0A6C0AFF0_9ZZZZ
MVIRLDKNSKYLYNTFKTTASIDFENSGKKISDYLVTIDTGCNITELFPKKIWDFEKEEFKNKIENIFYGDSFEKEFFFLNGNISNVLESNILTVGGICKKNVIEFNEPIKISLENLNPVDLYSFAVPLNNDDEDEYYSSPLIGLDIITQYNVNITTKNKRPIMTISDIEDDDNSSVDSNTSSISSSFKNLFKINK